MWKRFAFALCLGVGGCGGGDSSGNPDGTHDMGGPSDGPTADGGGCVAETPYQALLVAPTTAAVVPKTPTHPPVGDGGLP